MGVEQHVATDPASCGAGAGSAMIARMAPGPGTRWWRDVFGIDPRALGAVRIGLGLALIVDLSRRTHYFAASYTDAGVVPRLLLDPWMTETVAPFHLWGGSFAYQAFLFALLWIFAGMLIVGWHSRIASIGCWALVTSIQIRNPFLQNFGDSLFRMALFWAMLLPLGRAWSFDALHGRTHPGRRGPVVSVGTAAFLLQVCVMYLFTALLKSGPDWHREGSALYYALHLDYFATPVGVWLRQYPLLCEVFTRATLLLELVGPFLLLLPWWPVRALTAASFIALHSGIAMSYVLGIFPYVDIVVLLAFLPAPVWDTLDRLAAVRQLPRTPPLPPDAAPRRRPVPLPISVLAVVVGVYVVAYNVDGLAGRALLPNWMMRAGLFLGVNQEWRMFAPNAPRFDGWHVMPGTLASGEVIDLSHRGPELSWDPPPAPRGDHQSGRWPILLWMMGDPHNESLRRRYAWWRCVTWNRSHPREQRLESLELYFMFERPPRPGQQARPVKHLMLEHTCPPLRARPRAEAPRRSPP